MGWWRAQVLIALSSHYLFRRLTMVRCRDIAGSWAYFLSLCDIFIYNKNSSILMSNFVSAVKSLLIELSSGTKYEYNIGLNKKLAKIAFTVFNIIYTHYWLPATLLWWFLDLGMIVFEALKCWCCWDSMCKHLSMCGRWMRREAAILPWPELWPRYFRSWSQSILKTKLGSVWSEMILVRRAF